MTERILETHNIFIDTSAANKESNSRGDDFQLHLNTQAVDADRGQFIRLTVNEFNMYKTFTDVNDNNRTFIIANDNTTAAKVALTKQNYETLSDLAQNFADVVAARLLTDAQGNGSTATTATISDLTPASTTSINGTTDNIISFKITFDAAHTLTTVLIQFLEEEGEAYALLGGDRIYGSTPSIENSVVTSFPSGTEISVQCLYPGQRHTSPHIYLRTSLTTGASETASLTRETNVDLASEVSYSNVLAKIPVNTEFCNFTANTGREYFIDLRQKHLNNIRLYLTDNKNRRIGRRPANTQGKTASGYDNVNAIEQSTLGNLSFSCVLRVEVVQGGPVNEVQFGKQPEILPARMTGPLVQTNRII